MTESIIIRADADTQMGTGHLMRCLALAQAWKNNGGRAIFVTSCRSEGLLQRLKEEEFETHIIGAPYPDAGDWDYTSGILAAHPDAWVVLDGYHFDEAYQQQVKQAGHRLLVIDDMAHLKHYYADIVLNQNLHAEQLSYLCEPYTSLLLGTKYVLLRREFLSWKEWKREVPEVAKKVLVTLGGSDPENQTLKVIEALQGVSIPGLEAVVVVGAGNPHMDELEAAVAQSHIPIRLIYNAQNMPELMAWADVAICGAGTTVWELIYFRIPIFVFILAENQQYIAEQVKSLRIGRILGKSGHVPFRALVEAIASLLSNYNSRSSMSQNTQKIVDGQGAVRLVDILRVSGKGRLSLRLVTSHDCRMLWQWANDPFIRASSFSKNYIPWEEHVRWFEERLHDLDWYCYIVLDDKGLPVGQVRFTTRGNEADISVSLSSFARGQGYGAEAIRLASERLFSETSVNRVYAYIIQGNIPSIRAFAKAGYKENGTDRVEGERALRMVIGRNEEL